MKNMVIDINIFMDFLFKRQGHESVMEILIKLKRNTKDFKESVIPAKTPEEILLIINNEWR
jgi:hypothetical protein